MTARNLYGQDGDEYLVDDIEEIAERAWDDGAESPIEVLEWEGKLIRDAFNVPCWLAVAVERICEYDLEEMMDAGGNVWDKLTDRASAPEVVEAFTAAIDLLFEPVKGWRVAQNCVGAYRVSWEDGDPSRTPDFKIEKIR